MLDPRIAAVAVALRERAILSFGAEATAAVNDRIWLDYAEIAVEVLDLWDERLKSALGEI